MVSPRPLVAGMAASQILALPACASTIRIPAHQPMIQAGFDGTTSGDTVLALRRSP